MNILYFPINHSIIDNVDKSISCLIHYFITYTTKWSN